MRTAAAELALTLVETWQGVDGDETFDFIEHYHPALIIRTSTGPARPEHYDLLGTYAIQWSDYDYTATLSSMDIGGGLKALNVAIAWSFGNSRVEVLTKERIINNSAGFYGDNAL